MRPSSLGGASVAALVGFFCCTLTLGAAAKVTSTGLATDPFYDQCVEDADRRFHGVVDEGDGFVDVLQSEAFASCMGANAASGSNIVHEFSYDECRRIARDQALPGAFKAWAARVDKARGQRNRDLQFCLLELEKRHKSAGEASHPAGKGAAKRPRTEEQQIQPETSHPMAPVCAQVPHALAANVCASYGLRLATYTPRLLEEVIPVFHKGCNSQPFSEGGGHDEDAVLGDMWLQGRHFTDFGGWLDEDGKVLPYTKDMWTDPRHHTPISAGRCAVISGSSGKVEAVDCNSPRAVLCEGPEDDPPFQEQWQLCQPATTLADARAMCEEIGLELVSLERRGSELLAGNAMRNRCLGYNPAVSYREAHDMAAFWYDGDAARLPRRTLDGLAGDGDCSMAGIENDLNIEWMFHGTVWTANADCNLPIAAVVCQAPLEPQWLELQAHSEVDVLLAGVATGLHPKHPFLPHMYRRMFLPPDTTIDVASRVQGPTEGFVQIIGSGPSSVLAFKGSQSAFMQMPGSNLAFHNLTMDHFTLPNTFVTLFMDTYSFHLFSHTLVRDKSCGPGTRKIFKQGYGYMAFTVTMLALGIPPMQVSDEALSILVPNMMSGGAAYNPNSATDMNVVDFEECELECAGAYTPPRTMPPAYDCQHHEDGGQSYRGGWSTTLSGKECLSWAPAAEYMSSVAVALMQLRSEYGMREDVVESISTPDWIAQINGSTNHCTGVLDVGSAWCLVDGPQFTRDSQTQAAIDLLSNGPGIGNLAAEVCGIPWCREVTWDDVIDGESAGGESAGGARSGGEDFPLAAVLGAAGGSVFLCALLVAISYVWVLSRRRSRARAERASKQSSAITHLSASRDTARTGSFEDKELGYMEGSGSKDARSTTLLAGAGCTPSLTKEDLLDEEIEVKSASDDVNAGLSHKKSPLGSRSSGYAPTNASTTNTSRSRSTNNTDPSPKLMDQVTVTNILGSGSSGQVMLATWRGEAIAMKTMTAPMSVHIFEGEGSDSAFAERRHFTQLDRMLNNIQNELAVGKELSSHPNIVTLHVYEVLVNAILKQKTQPLHRTSMEGQAQAGMASADSDGTLNRGMLHKALMDKSHLLKRRIRQIRVEDVHSHMPEIMEIDNLEICMIMEVCDFGDLEKAYRNHPLAVRHTAETSQPIVPAMLTILLEIATAMAFLHAKGIVHADLKPANILLATTPIEKPTDLGITAKVSDFGLSVVLEEKQSMKDTLRGTFMYMAPEVMLRRKLSKAADVWSFGAVMATCLSGRINPLGNLDIERIMALHMSGGRPFVFLDHIATGLVNIINACMDPEPQNRPDFNTVVGWLKAELARATGDPFPTIQNRRTISSELAADPVVHKSVF